MVKILLIILLISLTSFASISKDCQKCLVKQLECKLATIKEYTKKDYCTPSKNWDLCDFVFKDCADKNKCWDQK